jgi:hypothetical protein
MKTERRAIEALVGILLALAASHAVLAHHSTAAEFDPNRPVSFTGTVEKVQWLNPHVYTHISVKPADGPPVVYHVEGSAPNTLFRNGWRKDSLKAGDIVTVTGWRAKNPESSNVGQATITRADGSKVFSGDGPSKVASE